MPKVTYVAADGKRTTLELAVGATLMSVATRMGVDGIAGDCGGVMSCSTCHVYVDEPFLSRLPPLEGEEGAMLEFTAAERVPDSRLSCQIRMTEELDGMVVRMPATQY